jgi:aromatic-L-amino-acid/L-tryptophan decarboxylase
MRKRVVSHNTFARDLARLIEQSPTLQLMAPVTLSTCCFRSVPHPCLGCGKEMQVQLNKLNLLVLERVRARGRYIPSWTTINGDVVLRACFITPRMTSRSVEGLVREVEECGAEVWSEFSV